MDQLVVGLEQILQVQNILLMVAGLVVGIVIGAIPGLNVPLAVALALPFTFGLPPLAGISMLIGIYKGGTYGGSISAILLNVPGTPAAAATAMDGNALARQGKSGKALKLSIYASVIGELASDIVLILAAVQVSRIALKFGPPEFFALGLFALTIIGLISGTGLVRGIIAGALGILLSLIGIDPVEGSVRLTFGVYELSGGLEFIALIIGIFAVSEALIQVEKSAASGPPTKVIEISPNKEDGRVSRQEFIQALPAILRGTPLGIAIGAIPGLGSSIAAFLSYGLAKKFSRHPEEFGKGSIEGLAAAESANNAVTGSTFIPLLTLGIPGDVITAIMLGALTVHGIVPGPALFQNQGDFITALFLGMLIVTCLHFLVAMVGLPLFIRAVRVPRGVLFPLVIVLCVTGAYVATANIFDTFVMLGFGVLGYVMTKFGFPIAPLLIGFILGPLVELSLRQSLIISGNSLDIFYTRPVPLIIFVLTALILVSVGWQRFKEFKQDDN